MTEKINGGKIIIISSPFCIRCKQYIFVIENFIDYEVVKVNNSRDSDVLRTYGVKANEPLPVYILTYNGKELYRSHEPISPQWAINLINLINKRNIVQQ